MLGRAGGEKVRYQLATTKKEIWRLVVKLLTLYLSGPNFKVWICAGIGDLESAIDPSDFSTILIIFLGDYCDRGGLQREWRDKGGRRRKGRVVQSSLGLPFKQLEIEDALKMIGAMKSRGPDGMSALFYQRYYVVGDDIFRICLHVLNGDTGVAEFNPSLIALIPNVAAPTRSTFIPQHMILDNVLAAFELIHWLKMRGKNGRNEMILNLDIAKAYIRGWPFGKILPSRGLQKGDPISSYLFLIVAEGLSALLQQAEIRGTLHRVWATPSALSLSASMFPSWRLKDIGIEACHEVLKLKTIISAYEKASSPKVNFDMLAICFSPSTPHDTHVMLQDMIGISVEGKMFSKAGREALLKVELISFNQALVGQQGWRLLEFLNSLIAQMLKARYYENSNFMEAIIGLAPSFTWRFIL
ncbi:hypothetical protein FF1_024893 [Malus domestica]